MSSSKAKSSTCSTLLLWSHMMYQRAVNGSATSVWRQIKRAEGGQISSTTLVYVLVVSMTKKLSDCNLRGVVSHHLSYMSVKGRRICIIGLSGLLSCGTYLSVMSIVRCPIMLVFVGNQYVQSNYKNEKKLLLWTKQQKNTTTDGIIAKQYINHLDILSGTSVSCLWASVLHS